MGIIEEFEAYYGETVKNLLPVEFTEKYAFEECLRCADGVETILVSEKRTGKKIVAKCYKKDSTFYDREVCFQELQNGEIPYFEGEYQNEKYRCICREYIEGISLDEYVRTTHITQEGMKELVIKLANAMKKLHEREKPVIHRDIKPSNIIVKEDGGIALIDFGISRIFKENETLDTTFWGTEEYASPEQYGFMQTDARSDIYSFGIVLTWLLTGSTTPIKNPSTKLEKIAAKCCSFSPEKRYQNDGALLKALYKTTKPYTMRAKKTARRVLAAIFVLTAVLFEAGIIYRTGLRDKAVTFHEPLIEEAVREVLGRPKDIVTYKDLEEITGIYIQGDKACPSLDDFYIELGKWYGAAREDRVIGPVEDISDLANMPNLQQVCIVGNRIRDISPLKELKDLRKLELGDNEIEDISPLANKEMLSEACFTANKFKDIKAVGTWPAIKVLGLNETGGYDGSPVGSLKSMMELNIRNDSDAYQYLKGIHTGQLEIGAPGQGDLECIRDAAHVERLFIRWSEIHDISALEGREDIVYLNMEGCAIDDLSPLFTMPNLASVNVSAGEQEQMEELISVYGEPGFEIIYTY